MCDKLKICVIKEIDFDDFEECIAKDYRHYVKLKSREEPYEVSDYTYKEVLKWVAKMNAKREELKPCPWCEEVPDHYEGKPDPFRMHESIWRIVHECNTETSIRIETLYYRTKDEAVEAWNRRAE